MANKKAGYTSGLQQLITTSYSYKLLCSPASFLLECDRESKLNSIYSGQMPNKLVKINMAASTSKTIPQTPTTVWVA